jgi:hypothetical protein
MNRASSARHQLLFVAGRNSDRATLSDKRFAVYNCLSTFTAPGLSCRARGISESATLKVLCSNCALSPAPQRACRSGRRQPIVYK